MEIQQETKGRTRLVLHKLSDPRRRADKKLASYAIDVHYLSLSGGVQGSDYGLFTKKEIAGVLSGKQSLFDAVELQ